MKTSFSHCISRIILLSALTALTACSSSPTNDEDPTPLVPTDQPTTLHKYAFTRNGVSTVDIGESKNAILAFRFFNNAINNKVPGNFRLQLQRYQSELHPLIGPTLSAKDRALVADSVMAMTLRLQKIVESDAVNRPAAMGRAGFLVVSADEQRMLDGRGIEYGQVIQKTLMGALTLDRVDYYLEAALQNASNTTLVTGKNYTQAEHEWDIAWGYLGTLEADPARFTPLFLANYIEKEAVGMKGLSGIDTQVYEAFYQGRKALTEGRTTEAKRKRDEIRQLMYKMFSLRAIYYLRDAKLYLDKTTGTPAEGYFHSMGEAMGFIVSLPFVRDTEGRRHISLADAFSLCNTLIGTEKGLWDRERLTGVAEGSIAHAIGEIDRLFP